MNIKTSDIFFVKKTFIVAAILGSFIIIGLLVDVITYIRHHF